MLYNGTFYIMIWTSALHSASPNITFNAVTSGLRRKNLLADYEIITRPNCPLRGDVQQISIHRLADQSIPIRATISILRLHKYIYSLAASEIHLLDK